MYNFAWLDRWNVTKNHRLDANYERAANRTAWSQVENVETTNDYASPCTSSVYLYSAHPVAVFATIDPLQLRAMLEPTFTRDQKVKTSKSYSLFLPFIVFPHFPFSAFPVTSYRKKLRNIVDRR